MNARMRLGRKSERGVAQRCGLRSRRRSLAAGVPLGMNVVAAAALLVLVGCTMEEWAAIQRQQQNAPQWVTRPPPSAMADLPLGPEPQILPLTYFRAGQLHETNGAPELAIEQYQRAIALNQNFVAAYNRIGIVLDRLGRYENANEAFLKAIELQPGEAYLRNNLAFSYMLQHRWRDAEAELRNALQLSPRFARVRINLGLTLGRLERYDETLAQFRQVLPEAAAQYNVGLCYRANRHDDEAMEAFRRAVALEPGMAVAQTQIDAITASQRTGARLDGAVPALPPTDRAAADLASSTPAEAPAAAEPAEEAASTPKDNLAQPSSPQAEAPVAAEGAAEPTEKVLDAPAENQAQPTLPQPEAPVVATEPTEPEEAAPDPVLDAGQYGPREPLFRVGPVLAPFTRTALRTIFRIDMVLQQAADAAGKTFRVLSQRAEADRQRRAAAAARAAEEQQAVSDRAETLAILTLAQDARRRAYEAEVEAERREGATAWIELLDNALAQEPESAPVPELTQTAAAEPVATAETSDEGAPAEPAVAAPQETTVTVDDETVLVVADAVLPAPVLATALVLPPVLPAPVLATPVSAELAALVRAQPRKPLFRLDPMIAPATSTVLAALARTDDLLAAVGEQAEVALEDVSVQLAAQRDRQEAAAQRRRQETQAITQRAFALGVLRTAQAEAARAFAEEQEVNRRRGEASWLMLLNRTLAGSPVPTPLAAVPAALPESEALAIVDDAIVAELETAIDEFVDAVLPTEPLPSAVEFAPLPALLALAADTLLAEAEARVTEPELAVSDDVSTAGPLLAAAVDLVSGFIQELESAQATISQALPCLLDDVQNEIDQHRAAAVELAQADDRAVLRRAMSLRLMVLAQRDAFTSRRSELDAVRAQLIRFEEVIAERRADVPAAQADARVEDFDAFLDTFEAKVADDDGATPRIGPED